MCSKAWILYVEYPVVVKASVKEPDTGMDLGGWQGRIAKIEKDNLLCIDWDSQTLKNIPDSHITDCELEGFWSLLRS